DGRHVAHNRVHVAMRLEPDPFDSVRTRLKTGDMNPKVRDMMLLSPRLRVRNPDGVVPPSELGCHGRRLMVQSLSHVCLASVNALRARASASECRARSP